MIPTLIGRLQTRLAIVALIDVPVTVVLGVLLDVSAGKATLVGLVIGALCLAWELVWHGTQQLRWDKDWPSILAFAVGVPEAYAGKVVLAALGVLPFHQAWGTYLVLFSVSWVLGWILQQGPLRVLFPSWRFEGGRLLARRTEPAALRHGAGEDVRTPTAKPVRSAVPSIAAGAVAATSTAGQARRGRDATTMLAPRAQRGKGATAPIPKPYRNAPAARSGGPGRPGRRSTAAAGGRRRPSVPMIAAVGVLVLAFGVFASIGLGTSDHGEPRAGTPAAIDLPVAKAPAAEPAKATGPQPQAWAVPDSQSASSTWDTTARVLPYAITVPRLSMQTTIEPVGLTPARTIATPRSGSVGWYQSASAPGQAGPTVILGSLAGKRTGVFRQIGRLVKGDTILLTRTDSVTVQYLVTEVQRTGFESFPTAKVYQQGPKATVRLVGYRGSGAHGKNVIVYGTALRVMHPKSA